MIDPGIAFKCKTSQVQVGLAKPNGTKPPERAISYRVEPDEDL